MGTHAIAYKAPNDKKTHKDRISDQAPDDKKTYSASNNKISNKVSDDKVSDQVSDDKISNQIPNSETLLQSYQEPYCKSVRFLESLWSGSRPLAVHGMHWMLRMQLERMLGMLGMLVVLHKPLPQQRRCVGIALLPEMQGWFQGVALLFMHLRQIFLDDQFNTFHRLILLL